MGISLTSKLKSCFTEGANSAMALQHWCPGCKNPHVILISKHGYKWDYNKEKPTIMPSVTSDNVAPDLSVNLCRYTLVEGILTFSESTTHSLRGEAVTLPDFPTRY
jgi:hypothetical protein